ncbi:hypothetical protein dsx2_0965 [Desulfovibrio sp. X2]|nr:hypothetical protein dsx2_0965 [Desulfovibrio sp. X2]
MSTMMKFLCLLAFVLVFMASAENPGRATDTVDAATGEALLHRACTVCHTSENVCANLGRDEAWWQSTLTRMRQQGAALSADDVNSESAYLAAQAPGAAPICK